MDRFDIQRKEEASRTSHAVRNDRSDETASSLVFGFTLSEGLPPTLYDHWICVVL